MTPAEYKSARQLRGTQQGVADALGVSISTVQRREAGDWQITKEAALAILSLRVRKTRRGPRKPNTMMTNSAPPKP